MFQGPKLDCDPHLKTTIKSQPSPQQNQSIKQSKIKLYTYLVEEKTIDIDKCFSDSFRVSFYTSKTKGIKKYILFIFIFYFQNSKKTLSDSLLEEVRLYLIRK